MVAVRTIFALAAVAALGACRGDAEPASEDDPTRAGPTADEVKSVAAGGIQPADPAEGGAAAAGGDYAVDLDRDTYVVRVDAPETASVGEQAAVAVHVVPKEGWKMNYEFPMLLEVTAPEGVAIEGAEQKIPDAVHYGEERGEWSVKVTPEAAGEANFEANFRFAVCTDEVCVPKREKLAWTIDVE